MTRGCDHDCAGGAQVHLGEKDTVLEGVRITPFEKFCAEVGVP